MCQEGADGVVGVEFAMAGLAVEAVKLEVLVELWKADEALQGRRAHLGNVFELHVVGNQRFDLVDIVVGEAEAATDYIGHPDADFDVAVEADAIAGFGGGAESRGLADVVEEHSPSEGGGDPGGKALEHEASVDPDVAFGVVLRGLRDAFHGGDFREELGEKIEFIEELEAAAGGAFGEGLGEFLADALGRDDMNFVGVLANSSEGCGFDGVAEARGKTGSAEHAELVFGEAVGGFPDGANDSGGEVGTAADEVEDFIGVVAHEQAVDGEVAPLNVLLRSLSIDDLIGVAAVGIAEVGAEGGDFDFEGVLADEDDTELNSHIEAVWKELENFRGRGVGGDVVIEGIAVEKNIAHTATSEQRLVSAAFQDVADRIGQIPGIHGMIMRHKEISNEAKK